MSPSSAFDWLNQIPTIAPHRTTPWPNLMIRDGGVVDALSRLPSAASSHASTPSSVTMNGCPS